MTEMYAYIIFTYVYIYIYYIYYMDTHTHTFVITIFSCRLLVPDSARLVADSAPDHICLPWAKPDIDVENQWFP